MDSLTINAGSAFDRNGFQETTAGGGLIMNGGSIVGTGQLIMPAGNITGTGGIMTGGTFDLGGAVPTVTITNGTLTIADQVTDGGLTIGAGTGYVILSNSANNWATGPLTVNGNLKNGASNVIPDAINVVMPAGGSWDLSGYYENDCYPGQCCGRYRHRQSQRRHAGNGCRHKR